MAARYTVNQYTEMLKALLPPGRAFPRDSDTRLHELLESFAVEFVELDEQTNQVVIESNPEAADALIGEWETEMGFPDECYSIPSLLADRRAQILGRLTVRGGQSIDHFYQLAESLGYNRHPSATDPHIQIVEWAFAPFRVGRSLLGTGRIYDGTAGESEYAWTVRGTNVEIDSQLQALLTKHKPAHTDIVWENA